MMIAERCGKNALNRFERAASLSQKLQILPKRKSRIMQKYYNAGTGKKQDGFSEKNKGKERRREKAQTGPWSRSSTGLLACFVFGFAVRRITAPEPPGRRPQSRCTSARPSPACRASDPVRWCCPSSLWPGLPETRSGSVSPIGRFGSIIVNFVRGLLF